MGNAEWTLLAIIINAVFFGIFSRLLCIRKGLNPSRGFALGFFFSLFGFLYCAVLPPEDSAEIRSLKHIGEMLESLKAEAQVDSKDSPAQPAKQSKKADADDSIFARRIPAGSKDGEELCTCSVCGDLQRADRKVCFTCGRKFIE